MSFCSRHKRLICFTEATLDGDRITRERAEADRARRAAESAQARLFASQNSK